MGSEQRVHVRVSPHPARPVQVQIIGSDFLDVLVPVDVSEGGLGLRVPHHFEGCAINGVLDFIIKLPGVRAFQVKGMIRHIRDEAGGKGIFGVQFVSLRAEQRGLLRTYIDERLTRKSRIG